MDRFKRFLENWNNQKTASNDQIFVNFFVKLTFHILQKKISFVVLFFMLKQMQFYVKSTFQMLKEESVKI